MLTGPHISSLSTKIWNKVKASPEPKLSRDSNNFDLLRLIAAVLVIVAHSPHVLSDELLPFDPIRYMTGKNMGHFAVLVFFSISGFLITASWLRKPSIVHYSISRILRIVPALFVLIILTVFILGPSITTKTLGQYLHHPATFQYLQNASVFRMYYYLPGVFENNPSSTVNASLWTIAYECACYMFVAIAGMAGILKSKYTMLSAYILCSIGYYIFREEFDAIVIPVIGIDFKTFVPVLLYFLAGSALFQCRKRIPFKVIIGIMLMFVLFLAQWFPFLGYLDSLIIPYAVISLAFYRPWGFPVRLEHDISYGVYLYGYPVQQIIVFFWGDTITLSVLILTSIFMTLPLAMLSWTVVEKPAMALKNWSVYRRAFSS